MVILARIVMGVLRHFLEKRTAAAIGIAAIIIYTIFVGAGGAVIRAAVMSGLLIWGQTMNRKTFVPASLALTAILMSLLDPWVLWDIGFQLSFAAVMGMALFVDPLERWLDRGLQRLFSDRTRRVLMAAFSDSLIVTTAAQITTTPLILLYFGRLSVVSLPVNLLIIPAQTPLLLFGALGTLIGLVIPPVGNVIVQLANIFLTWSVSVVEFFAELSWADQQVEVSDGLILAFFALLGLFLAYRGTRPRWARPFLGRTQAPVWGACCAGLVALLVVGNTVMQRPDDRLHVTFLDIGGANSVLIETPDGGVVLVNGGPFPARLLDDLNTYLPDRTNHIDALIITAFTEENVAALPEVAADYEIGALLTNGQSSGLPDYLMLLLQLQHDATPITFLSDGYTLAVDDGVEITVLQPAEDALVLRVTYGEAVFMLTGEIEAEAEQVLLANPHLLQATVLQVADHGSGDASGAGFVAAVNPQAAVIQVEAGNFAGDPSPVVINRLAGTQIFRTDHHGAVEFVTDGRTLEIFVEESPG